MSETGAPLPVESRILHPERHATILAVVLSVATVILVSLLLVARDPMFFWVCDYQLWYSGIFEEIARAWREGEWPILNRGSWAVPSLAGEYQCGTFSIVFNACLVLIWSLPLTLPGKAAALSIVHLSILAAGSALLARRRGLDAPASVMVGVIASLNGWMINWAATDWFVALSGFVWVPWSWWALEAAMASGRRGRWVLPAVFIYLTIAAGSPFAVLMLMVISAWLLARSWATTRRIGSVSPILVGWTLGLGLSAPAWLMLIEYHRFSVRGSWPDLPQWSWVVPWRAWLGLLLPSYVTDWRNWSGTLRPHFCIEMAGGLVPVAAAFAAYAHERIAFFRRWKWELCLLGIGVALVSLPSFGSFRWSFRFLPLVHLTLALLGAACLQSVSYRRLTTTAFSLAIFASLVAVISGRNASALFLGVQLGLLFLWSVTTRLAKPAWLAWSPAAVSVGLLFVTYSSLSTRQGVSRHEFRDNLLQSAPLDPQRLYLSVHSFEDILRGAHTPGWGNVLRPCNTALCAPLHFLNGYTSFSAKGVPAFFETHGSLQPQTVDALLGPECVELLDLLGVDGMIFGPDYLDRTSALGPEWQRAHVSDEATVFHREPRRHAAAKTLRRIDSRPGELLARPELTIQRNGRQEVIVEIEPLAPAEPGLVLSVIPSLDPARPIAIAFARPILPGYRATLNGKVVPVLPYQDYVPVVELPPGTSGKLVLSYSPASLRIGLLLSAATLIVLLALACWRTRRDGMGSQGTG